MKKNTIKYMAAALVLAAAAFASETTACAQDDYQVKNGIGSKKTATLNPDGSYTIDLQSFVTGKVMVTTEMKPVDVALVLDVSGSMEQAVSGTYIQESHYNYYYVANSKSPLFATDHADNKNFNYYYKDGDAYYKIEAINEQYRDTPSGDRVRRYILQFKKNGTNYLIGPEGPVQANATYKYNSQTTLWTEEGKTCSFTRTQGGANASTQWFPNDNVYRYKSRIELLKEATKSFVNTISYYDTHNLDGETIDRAHHQIAIVTFSDGATTLQGFTEVENVSAIETKVDEISVNGYTRTNLGVSKAMELFDGLPAERKTNSNKVMVLFTDGNPGGSNTFDTDIANGAIGAVTAFKNPDGAYKGVVYSIGMGLSGDNVNNFMNYVSSNYPYAENMDNPGAPAAIPAGDPGYYQSAGGADLSDIFETIAATATGGSGADITSTSIVTLDVVTNSFTIPEGAEDVQVLIAPLTAVTDNGDNTYSYTFGAEQSPEAYGDKFKDVATSINEVDNSVTLTGFPYSQYWCGPDESRESGISEGYKVILRFPIKLSDKVLGGPFTATNDEASGIYVDGKPVAAFKVPTVKLPVSIWIQKEGLEGNDSAVFTIYRAKANLDDPTDLPRKKTDNSKNGDYVAFTKVVVNKNDMDTDHIIKITGLDPDYYYMIKEDAWAWAYDRDQNVKYTVKYPDDPEGTKVQNPFVFTNTPKEGVAKHGEDVVRNEFVEKD